MASIVSGFHAHFFNVSATAWGRKSDVLNDLYNLPRGQRSAYPYLWDRIGREGSLSSEPVAYFASEREHDSTHQFFKLSMHFQT